MQHNEFISETSKRVKHENIDLDMVKSISHADKILKHRIALQSSFCIVFLIALWMPFTINLVTTRTTTHLQKELGKDIKKRKKQRKT